MDELLGFGFSLGKDLRVSTTRPVSIWGSAFAGVRPKGRLVGTGGEAKGDRIAHRIGITSVKEINREVKDWMLKAYQADQ